MRAVMKVLLACAACCGSFLAVGCQSGQTGRAGTSAAGAQDEAVCTILLRVFGGEGHAQEAEEYKHKTQEHAAWSDVYVVHHAGYSELYRGRYPSAEAAAADLKRAKSYRTPVGVQVFFRAIVMPLREQTAAQSEYDLSKAQGTFTIVVAEFYDVPNAGYVGQKKFAEQYCRQLRDKGLDAYVLHGPAKSLVSVGSFSESAYPAVTLDGKRQRVIRDPRMEELLKQYPKLAVNGRQDVILVPTKDGHRKEMLATASYVMEIPHKEPSADAAAPNHPGDAQSR